MEIKVTEQQYEEFCKNPKCVVELTKLLNNVKTKNIFRYPIDDALNRHKMFMPKKSKQYQEDSNALRQYLGYPEDKINELMKIRMMYDDEGNWMSINKLNTNYSDLAVLVTDILVDEGECICAITEQISSENYSALTNLASKIKQDPEFYYQKYLKGNYEKYTENNKRNTTVGNASEMFATKMLEENLGYKLVYMASEGSPIDTKLGIDMIMEKDGEYSTFQVKSVGSLSKTNETPCDISNPGLKKPGGYKVFKKNRINVNDSTVDFLVFITINKRILVMKKYQPISIESVRPLSCVATPINSFPANNTFIDYESVVYSNF
jgi:hypothetical protein